MKMNLRIANKFLRVTMCLYQHKILVKKRPVYLPPEAVCTIVSGSYRLCLRNNPCDFVLLSLQFYSYFFETMIKIGWRLSLDKSLRTWLLAFKQDSPHANSGRSGSI